jgi:Ca-activated chloride channel family protein
MIVLDCSLSMETEDIKPNRLEKARNQIKNFMKNLRGDRVGLVAFAGDAFVQCPLTLDYGAASLFLDNVDTGIIPEPGTAIGEAIKTAAGAFNKKERKYKLLVLITDGEDHEGDPVAAAQDAAGEGIIIYTIGIGTRKGEPIPLKDDQGKLREFKKDGSGTVVVSRLDEVTLEKIALAGGGKYFRATTGELELDAIHEDIGAMEKKALSGRFFTQMEDRFQIPLLIGILLILGEAFVSNRVRTKKAWEGRFK